ELEVAVYSRIDAHPILLQSSCNIMWIETGDDSESWAHTSNSDAISEYGNGASWCTPPQPSLDFSCLSTPSAISHVFGW
ncbi:Hypothetical predicted protein, partial [Pelobates cultripes]